MALPQTELNRCIKLNVIFFNKIGLIITLSTSTFVVPFQFIMGSVSVSNNLPKKQRNPVIVKPEISSLKRSRLKAKTRIKLQ